jgi:hypothetical protein
LLAQQNPGVDRKPATAAANGGIVRVSRRKMQPVVWRNDGKVYATMKLMTLARADSRSPKDLTRDF